jgi:putative spermidine/putrescine transport system permease protein
VTRPRPLDVAIGLACVAPFGLLVLQASADRWHGRAIAPQEVGTRGVRSVWGDPVLVDAIVGSLVVAVAVATVSTALAWPAARYLAESGSRVGWGLLAAPVLLPPLLLGDGLAVWLLQIGVRDGHLGIAVAHLAVALPYAAIALTPAFGPALDELDHTAAVLGAPPWDRLVRVVLPAARRHLVLGFALAFTVSWSQYGTSLGVGGGTPMLPLVLVPYVRSDPQVAAVLSLVFLVPPMAALGFAAGIGHQRRDQRRAASADARAASATTTSDATNAGLVG